MSFIVVCSAIVARILFEVGVPGHAVSFTIAKLSLKVSVSITLSKTFGID